MSVSEKDTRLVELQAEVESRDRAVDDFRARAAAAEHQLRAVLASRSWKIAESLGAAANGARRIVRALRRSAAGRPDSRVWLKERWRRRGAYRTIVANGLFDAK